MNKIPEIIIDFNSFHEPIEDFYLESTIICLKDGDVFQTSNEIAILAARYLHKKGVIKIKHITFNNEIIKVDLNGELDKYPDNFCDKASKYLLELV